MYQLFLSRIATAAAVLVALVAVHAVIDIPADALMDLVRLALGVAVRTLKDGVVIRVRVARGAHSICPAVIDIPPGMVEHGAAPAVRVVTGVAGRGEACRLVVRICCAVVVGRVTGIAERSCDVVVAVDVAVGTLPRRHRVLSGQRPPGCGVVERTVHPVDGVVADLACRREIGRDVVHGRLRVVVIVLVAAHTSGNRDVVIAVDMTIRTLPWRHRVITS